MEGETGGEITKRNKKSKWGNRRMYEYVCVCLCDRESMKEREREKRERERR